MGWGLRKRISLGKGIRLNLSKKGINTTIGFKGFSINFGKKGVYRNVSIPGTGIYSREKIGDINTTNQQQGKQNTTSTAVILVIIVLCLLFGCSIISIFIK